MLLKLFLIIFTFVELNCENLFDTTDDPLTNDDEFTENSLRHWDKRKYYDKLYNIAQEIISCALRPEDKGEGHMPDMIALCEVENDSVMMDLTKRSMLWSYRFDYLMTHSPDPRGINVALMYNPNSFKVLESNSIHVDLPDKRPTRDILYAKGLVINRDTLHVFVVHSPSRRGGERETRKDRMAVARKLTSQIDSLHTTFSCIVNNHIIVAGDFNDYSDNAAIKQITSHGIAEISRNSVGIYSDTPCKGTYFFNDEWNSLDHIFASSSLSDMMIDCYVNNNPKLMERNSAGIFVPKRTYRGIRYNNGYSDHLPLISRFNFRMK